MNKAILLSLYVVACFSAGALTVSCLSQGQFDAGRELAAAATEATDPAGPGGSTITPEEEARLSSLYTTLKGSEGVDWQQLGATVLASLATVFPALRFLPSRYILGTQPDPDVKRVAGTLT